MTTSKPDVQAPKTASPSLDVVFRPDVQALTDAEWREFQSIPEQGYSHRHWVDCKIQERLAAALSALSGETETEWEYGVRYSDQSERLLGTRKNAESHLHEDLSDTLIRRTRARPVPAGEWEVVL